MPLSILVAPRTVAEQSGDKQLHPSAAAREKLFYLKLPQALLPPPEHPISRNVVPIEQKSRPCLNLLINGGLALLL
jgi:hypothetical protein